MGILTTIQDRLLYAIGNEEAAGRLMRAAAIKDSQKQWRRYLGRHGVRQPNVRHFLNFIGLQYGLEISHDDERRIFGRDVEKVTFDFEKLAPRFANILINQGIIDVQLAG